MGNFSPMKVNTDELRIASLEAFAIIKIHVVSVS